MNLKKTPLFFKPTPSTPEVMFDPDRNVFEIKGRSIPEHALSFYGPILEWLRAYEEVTRVHTITFHFQLDYFNTPSAKPLLEIFRIMDEWTGKGLRVELLWHYRDDDPEMREVGEEFSQFIKTPLQLVPFRGFAD